MLFVGPDADALFAAIDALEQEGRDVRCIVSPFKALTACAASPPHVVVIDASRLDDQMLEVFEALKEVCPRTLILAAVSASARSRTARMLNLGSDAIIGLPADADEIRALLRKRKSAAVEKISVDQKFRWLGEFAAGVAHNINNPLTTVIGYLQILCSKIEPNQTSVLPTMLRECNRIADIVRNLLLFSGNGNIEPKPVDLNRAVDAALLLAAAAEQSDKVQVERSYQPGLQPVMADEEALKLACQNIAVNARQAMRNGGILSVETAQNGNGHAVIRFSDTGPGIPPDKLDRIFEPFYTGANNGQVGLGLATSYGIIKGFGGTISVTSQKGSGTTFVVELPLCT